MFTRVDRVQLAVPDRAEAAKGWQHILGAEHHADERVACLGAVRASLRLGNGWVELLEPDGAGPVADAVAARGGHLYAGGMATPDVGALAARLADQGVDAPAEHGQLFLDTEHTGGRGLRLVVSAEDDLPAVGAIDQFYEITNLVGDHETAVKGYVDLFGFAPDAFQPIKSDEYGYEGTLTLLDDARLDRFEVITPTAPDKTMGRYFSKFGDSLYMCFAETGAITEIEARCVETNAPHTRVPSREQRPETADTVFLHPGALGGMMLGLSRRSVAWSWSGHPDRVENWRQPEGTSS